MPSESDPLPKPMPAAERVFPEHRDQAVETLTQHFAGDRLSMEEFEQRTAAVYAARTVTDMRAALVDLPEIPAGTLEATSVLEDGQGSTPAVPGQQELTVVLSNHERRGTLVVPAKLRIRNILGNVELDLREATFTAAVTEIDISAVLGNIEITLPIGVHVESLGQAILGSFEAQSDTGVGEAGSSVVRARDSGMPVVVRLTGKAMLASVEVRNRGSRASKPQLPKGSVPKDHDTAAAHERNEPQRLLP